MGWGLLRLWLTVGVWCCQAACGVVWMVLNSIGRHLKPPSRLE
jgi:hypothetical protein